MKKSTLIVLILLFSFLQGCATNYQAQGLTGGFTETQLDKNVFKVSFRGNGYTSPERASDLALLRSAELTLLHGYKYFIVVENSDVVNVSTYTTPTTSYTTFYGNTAQTYTYGGQTYNTSRPNSTNVIVCFDEKPDNAVLSYNAEFVYKQLSAKYEIQ